MVTIVGLHSGPYGRPSLLKRVFSSLQPSILYLIILWHGLPRAFLSQLRRPNPLRWLSPWAWRDEILAAGMGPLLKMSDNGWMEVKGQLVANAKGDVLEVGAGSGATVKYYVEDKISSLTLIEPFEALHAELKQSIAARGPAFESKTRIVPHGIEATDKIGPKANAGFDSIVLVQCLCSIPNPQSIIPRLISMLKPGGSIIFFEHVASTSSLTRALQKAWTYSFWKFATNGCCLDRPTGTWLAALPPKGTWKQVYVLRPKNETYGDLVPHEAGILVKA